MRTTFKYRLYPTDKQKHNLQLCLDACRWVYNKTLETKKTMWEQEQKTLSFYDTTAFLPQWKKENPSIENTFAQNLIETQKRVDLAFKSFFRRIKNKENPGYPRFKSYDRFDSFVFPQNDHGFKLIDNKLRIAKVGIIKVKKHREIIGNIKNCTIKKTNTNKWHAYFTVEYNNTILKPLDNTIGIDVGITTFATLSNNTKIRNPRFFKNDRGKLTKAQQKLSKQVKGSGARKKCKKIVAHIHEKIVNKRTNFAHQESRKIVNTYGTIVVENLNIQSMIDNKKININKSINDVAWNQFINNLSYKAEDAGRKFIKIDPRNTSQMCSRCGAIVKKDLSVRIHNCSCGLVIDRDLNAAINILRLGLQSLGKQSLKASNII